MEFTSRLPKAYIQRYRGWRATEFADNRSWSARLANDGQRPRAMVIACCDSRVHVTSIFGADAGEFFIHRNIANLIPPYKPDGDLHGTSAAIEYAVISLRVAHLIVLGHSGCGGVEACDKMCRGAAPELDLQSSFIGRWLDLLRSRHAHVAAECDTAARLRALEEQAIRVSLENLMTFPYVLRDIEAGTLALHGLWNDIGTGQLKTYDPEVDAFVAV